MGVELLKTQGCFSIFVIVDDNCLRIAEGASFPFPGGAADLAWADA